MFSRVQSLIIKNGYELENLITAGLNGRLIPNLDNFLQSQIMARGVQVVEKKVIRKSNMIESHGIGPDFIIFRREGKTRDCYIVELKDGHEFDTKSSAKEHANLNAFLSKNAMALQSFQSYCKICGFNAQTQQEILSGFKRKIALSQAMTGKEFCDLVELPYEQILQKRAEDRAHNFDTVINALLDIPSVRTRLKDRFDG